MILARIKNLINRYPCHIALFGIVFFWLSFYMLSGTITSGFHLTDDHEIFELRDKMAKTSQSAIGVAYGYIHTDIFGTGRFRPLYYAFRFVQIGLFKSNSLHWSIFVACLAVTTSLMFYLAAKKMGSTAIEAFLFVFVVLIGRQAAIWWRLGPAEMIGTVLMAFTFYFLAVCARAKNFRIWPEILFTTVTILMSLAKESFVLLVPAILFLKVGLQTINGGRYERKAYFSIVLPGLVCLLEIIFIKYFMKMGGLSYAGVEGLLPLRYLFLTRVVLSFNNFIVIIGLILFSLLIFGVKDKDELLARIDGYWKANRIAIVFLLLVILPQTVLYAKSGINADRYILPSTLGLAVFYLFLFRYLRESRGKYWLYLSAILALGYSSIMVLQSTIIQAKAFASEGRELQSITNQLTTSTEASDTILIASDPAATPEWSSSIFTLVKKQANRENLVSLPISQSAKSNLMYRQHPELYCDPNCFSNLKDNSIIKAIIIFPDAAEAFPALNKEWFDEERFTCHGPMAALQFNLCFRR